MKPIEFEGQNSTYAKDQPQYMPLPTLKLDDGKVVSCWKMSWRERFLALLTGKVWMSVLTFNKPLQPSRLDMVRPFNIEKA